MPPQSEILNQIKSGKLSLPPAHIRLANSKGAIKSDSPNALLEIDWQNRSFAFVAVIKPYSSNRIVAEAIREAKYIADKLKKLPLIITPWLSPEQLQMLDSEVVSGIDLSGNGIIIVPGKISIFRSGNPNAFPASRLVKNVYQGNTSLVARAFLLKPEYSSVKEIVKEIQNKNGLTTQSTVSKALKQLEEDAVIWRDRYQIKLVQPDKLLDRLAANYKKPQILSESAFKFETDFEQIPKQMLAAASTVKANIICTGTSSVDEYATMAREKQYFFYCDKEPETITNALGKSVTTSSRFPNVKLLRTEDKTIYFDMRIRNKRAIASPIQAYLELMAGDKRDQETAQQIRKSLLISIKDTRNYS